MSAPTDKEIADVLTALVLPDGKTVRVPVNTYGTVTGTWTLAHLFNADARAHTGLTIRQPKNAFGLGVKTLFVEVDYQKHRNRITYFFQARVDLTTPGWPTRLTSAILRAYQELPKRQAEKLAHADNRQKSEIARTEYTAELSARLGGPVMYHKIITGAGSFPLGLRESFDITGTPEQVAQKLNAIQSLLKS